VLGTPDGQHGLFQKALELRMFLKDMAPGYGVKADETPFRVLDLCDGLADPHDPAP
jgi:hypothetical protein